MTSEEELEGSSRPMSGRDRAHFWRDARFSGLECLSATFHSLEFAPHSHETYCIGAMEAGIQKSRIRGTSHEAGVGDFYLINPDIIHEGRPSDNGYRYRMIYPSVELVAGLLEDARGRTVTGTPSFSRDTMAAPALAGEFLDLHRLIETGRDTLQAESRFQTLMLCLMGAVAGESIEVPRQRAGRAVGIARDYLDAHFAEEVSLADLTRETGLSRAHLIRAFKREFHTPPHSWLTDRRIREARRLLVAGSAISQVAFECGFSDQAHLTRHFKARVGVTPAQFLAKAGQTDVVLSLPA